MLFLGIISWKGASSFNGGGVFQMGGGGFIFKWRVSAMGGIGSGVAVGVSKKIVGRGGHPMPHQPSMGNPA